MTELAEEFRLYSNRGQVLVSTHSPDFLNSSIWKRFAGWSRAMARPKSAAPKMIRKLQDT
jgi:predicted ATPase